jgi:hypothetical protein
LAEADRSIDAIADELYAMQPDGFAAARDAAVKEARAGGRSDLARELARLRRPTRSAWLINLLWRNERELLESLLDLGDAFRDAQAQASGGALQKLMAQRRQVEQALIRRGKDLAAHAGADVSDAMEREAQETLSAALALPDVADEIRGGRLTRAANYAGFGVMPSGPSGSPRPGRPAQPARMGDRSASTSGPTPGPSSASRSSASDKLPTADLAAYRAEKDRERAREEAERKRVAEQRADAQAVVDRARDESSASAAALAQASTAADEAAATYEQLHHQVDAARAELQRLQVEASRAEERAVETRRARGEAERAHDAAQITLHRAERALDALPPQ